MNVLPSPQKVANTYMGNPAPLAQKVQQAGQQPNGLPNDLLDAIALSMVQEQQQRAKNAMLAQQQVPQGTVMDRLKAQVVGAEKEKLARGIASAMPQEASQPQAGGIDQLQSSVGQNFAGGGIVAFDNGGDVDDSSEFMKDFRAAAAQGAAGQDMRRADEAQTLREIALERIRAQQAELERRQSLDAADAASPMGYFFTPGSQRKDAEYVKAHLPETRNYGNESRRGIPAALAAAATTGSTQPGTMDVYRTRAHGGLPAAAQPQETGGTGYGGARGAGSPAQADGDTFLGANFKQLSPETLRLMKAKAEAGDEESQNFLRLYLARFPDPDTPLEAATKRLLGLDMDAEGIKAIQRTKDTIGADPVLAEQRANEEKLMGLRHAATQQRSPWNEYVRSALAADPRKGVFFTGAAGTLGLGDAYQKWANEDVTNQSDYNKGIAGINKLKLDANTEAAKAGNTAYGDSLRALGVGVTAGESAEARKLSATQSADARKYDADIRLEIAREKLAQLGLDKTRESNAQIAAKVKSIHDVITSVEAEIKQLDPLIASGDKTGEIAKRRNYLQAQVDDLRKKIVEEYGYTMPSSGTVVGAIPPGAVVKKISP